MALVSHYHLSPHRDKLGLLLRKCPVAVVSVEHVGYRSAEIEFGSRVGNSALGHRLSVAALETVRRFAAPIER